MVYRIRVGKLIEEKAGRQNKVDKTPSRASKIRARRIHGDESSDEERREATRALSRRWTIGKAAEEYFTNRDRRKSVQVDRYLYKRFLSDDSDKKIPEERDPLSFDRFRKALSKRLTSKGPRVRPPGRIGIKGGKPLPFAALRLLTAIDAEEDQDAASVHADRK